MRSMTGYGEAAAQSERAKVVVQVRSLNHRHLDIQTRIPREYLPVEEEIRKAVRQKIARGRVELFVTRSALKGHDRKVELDEEMLRQYLRSLNRAKSKFGLKGNVDLSLLARLPELFQVGQEEMKPEDEKKLVLGALELALKHLDRSREREGRQLKADLLFQLKQLREICAALTREAKALAQARMKETPLAREEETPVGKTREAPESFNQALKGDVNEEVVRLKSHVGELGSLFQAEEPIGKRLDFLIQEIQRELNTIASKVPHLPVTRLILSGKEKVERIREQAQNIE